MARFFDRFRGHDYDRDERNRGEFSGGQWRGDDDAPRDRDSWLGGDYARDSWHRGFGGDYGRDDPRAGGSGARHDSYGTDWRGDVRGYRQSPGISHRGRGPKNWRRSDDRIFEEVNEILTEHHELDASEIEVKVENGEVTLTGLVASRRDKRLAEDLAESCRGVVDVHNQLRIQLADAVSHLGKASE